MTNKSPKRALAEPNGRIGDVREPLIDDLCSQMRTAHGFRVAEIQPLVTGYANNNRLLRLRAEDGREALAKIYFRDALRRLETEYGALAFFRQRSMPRVPRPYARSDEHYYAVYSFEPGAIKPAAALTDGDITELAHFAADLHRFRPGAPGADFRLAQHARLSFAAQVDALRRRLAAFVAFAGSADTFEGVRGLVSEVDVAGEIDRLIRAAIDGLDASELERRVPEDQLRLNSSDFAPHNVLVQHGGGVCVVDFEFFGWDDPDALAACFLANGASLDLRPSAIGLFLDTYRAAAVGTLTARFPRVLALLHVAWCLVHLSLMTADHIARKRFASPELGVATHIAEQTAQFKRRLAIAEGVVQQLVDHQDSTVFRTRLY